MANVITNMLLPNVLLDVNPAGFGKMENRQSHWGALNTYYRNTARLIDAKTLAKIRDTPYTRTIDIPIFNKYDHPIGTVRTCAITTIDVGVTKKSIVRFHVEIDLDIVPSDYKNNAVSWESALAQKITMAKTAVYKYLDTMCATFTDANKDTSQTIGANTLYTGVLGEYQVPKTLDFFNNLDPIMEMKDINGPFWVLSNTAAKADMNLVQNNGGGALLNTKAIMDTAGIEEYDYSNRVAPGAGQRALYYAGPLGSIGIINFIDSDYQDAPDLNTLDIAEQKDISDVRYWNKINDNVFTDWQWGVQQLLDCSGGAKTYKAKLAADFALVADFTSVAGESPIKRFSIMGA